MKAIINKKVKHQNIGGKEICIERELKGTEFLDTDFSKMTPAMFNFIARRPDIFLEKTDEEIENLTMYYGHVGLLGYFVCEDEIRVIKK